MCDASSAADVAGLHQGLPLLAVFHAGGVLADATLQQQSMGGMMMKYSEKGSNGPMSTKRRGPEMVI
jgi:hypothetical protein